VRTIRRRQRHNPSHKPISAHEESIGDAESGCPPGCSVTAGRHDSPEQPPASRCTAIVIKSGGLSFRLRFRSASTATLRAVAGSRPRRAGRVRDG
jgi:hypothetical protein